MASTADVTELATPPPIPLYSTGVTKTTIFGPGMIVIHTRDPFETVLDWYKLNLRDRVAEVPMGPRQRHYVTRDGASVDVSVEGFGADAETKISLFWKTGGGAVTKPAAVPERADSTPRLAELGGMEPLPLLTEQPLAAHAGAVAPVPLVLPKPGATGEAESPMREPQATADLREGRYGEALLAFEDAAAGGSAAAALAVGMMFDAGLGVPQSYQDAFSWYEVAAEKDDPVAMFNIGVLDDAGLGLRRNPAQAAGWYEKAAAKGVGRAAFNLALLYESGDGVAQDDRIARRYFRQAERHGVTAARSHLPGRHVRQADMQDADLPFNTVHSIGNDRPERRRADTTRLMGRADRGDPVALYDLAYRLERGVGAEADPRGAYVMYRRVAAEATDERLRRVADVAAARLRVQPTAAAYKH